MNFLQKPINAAQALHRPTEHQRLPMYTYINTAKLWPKTNFLIYLITIDKPPWVMANGNLQNLQHKMTQKTFPKVVNLMDFQPSRVFVEYCHWFLPIFSENGTISLALKSVSIDVEFVWYSERTLFLLMWHNVHEIAFNPLKILNYIHHDAGIENTCTK